MAYRVDIASRAERDLARLYEEIDAAHSGTPLTWYRALKKAILSLARQPNRCPLIRKRGKLRHLLYGHGTHIYRVIYRVLEKQERVEVLHIRDGARREFRNSDLT